MTNDELTDILTDAIRSSLAAIVTAHAGEHLNGYALCTDDDVRTVYPVGCTTEFCAQAEEDDARYIPVDWPYGEGASSFDGVNAELRRRTGGALDHAKHVADTFECFVRALQNVREKDGLSQDVLLIVTSTDPGPRMEELAADAVRRLNTSDLYEAWQEVM